MQLLRSVKRSSLIKHLINTPHSYSRQLSVSGYCSAASASSAYTSSSSSSSSNPDPTPPTRSRFLPFLKFTSFAALAGALTAVGYATYAYTADEVDEKTKAFRSSVSHAMVDASRATLSLEMLPHMVYSTIMTGPSKAVDLYLDLRRLVEERVQELIEPCADKLLPDMNEEEQQHRVFTLVLDLSETLILSEWKRERGWSTFKRPGLDDFLQHLAQIYEIVVYSDVSMLDEQIVFKLQEKGVRYVLVRSATKYQDGKHFRDLSKLNRDPSRVLYVSGHALETCLQPENCVAIKPWKKEADDTTLIDLIPFLEYVGLHRPADIRPVLASYHGKDIASEFINRSREYQRQLGKKQKPFRWSHTS